MRDASETRSRPNAFTLLVKSMAMRIASSRRKTSSDVLDRLEKIIEEKKKEYPEWLLPPKQPTKYAELERSDAEASVMASGGDGSEEG